MLRGVWVALVLVLATIATGVPAILVGPWTRGDFVLRAARVWARAMLRATGAQVTWLGLERTRGPGPRVYIANHQSFVDVWALLAVLPARFVAKAELRRVPVLGWATLLLAAYLILAYI